MTNPPNLFPCDTPDRRPTIYLIGVPAAGKTTLIDALARRLRSYNPPLQIGVVTEVARELVLRSNVSHTDIKAGTDEAMQLQRHILEMQMAREVGVDAASDVVLCDRSGLDPIVFATQYGASGCAHALLESRTWAFLRERMRRGLVIVCEANWEWFVDDGVRVRFESVAEMDGLHAKFMAVLRSQEICFEVLPASTVDLDQRIDFAIDLFEKYHGPIGQPR